MPSRLEHKLEALARAGELMRPTFHRMRGAISAGEASEYITRLTKKDVIRICQWRYDWRTLYNYLVDRYGLYYINQGPKEKRVYTFKINILDEIAAGTTCLLGYEEEKFLGRLIAGNSSGDQHGPHSPKRLAGVSSGIALVLAKNYAEANRYLDRLSKYALEVGAGLGTIPIPTEDEEEFVGTYIEDIVNFGQGDPFTHEDDIEE